MTRDIYDICEECANKIKNIAEGKINEDVWANIHNPICDSSDDVHRGAGMIEKRETFWKEKTYQTVERGKGWEIQRPVEIKPLEDLLDDFFRRKKKWE